jgi:hypothetical protein
VRDRRARGALAEHRHAEAQQQILQYSQVALHRLAAHFAVAGDVADPALQRRGRIERVAQLGRHEGMHSSDHGPAGHEIDPASPQLARAGSGQHESPAAVLLNEGMDGAEQLRHPLDLVDDDHLSVGLSAHQIEEAFRTRPVALQGGRDGAGRCARCPGSGVASRPTSRCRAGRTGSSVVRSGRKISLRTPF